MAKAPTTTTKPAETSAPAEPATKSSADILLEMQLEKAQKDAINPLAVVSDEPIDEDKQFRNDTGAKACSIKKFANGTTVTRWV